MTTKTKPTRVLNVRIEQDLFLEVRSRAGKTDRTNAELVTEALRLLVAKQASAEGNDNSNPGATP
ncbi:MAG: hypothetical protein HYZ29_00905 [Myxococcales bacterium]|nr:hypothetical protein [Myxococcales bacterium]